MLRRKGPSEIAPAANNVYGNNACGNGVCGNNPARTKPYSNKKTPSPARGAACATAPNQRVFVTAGDYDSGYL